VSWLDAISGLAQRYSGQGSGTSSAPEDPHQDFDEVARHAPPEEVAGGLSQAFRSDRTPAFPEMVSNLFRNSDPNQRAGLLNRLLAGIGPGALAGLPGGLAGLLGGRGEVTPQQANQISPDQVQVIASHAEKQNPSVVDQVSSFYSQHPQVVKALGGLALTIALQHMMRRQ
jgi:hypothetical protein